MRVTEVAAEERTAVLVVRAWIEGTFEERKLRARITQTLDITSAKTVQTAAGSQEEIFRAVEEWLRTFVDLPPVKR
jgi:hypothetical protein